VNRQFQAKTRKTKNRTKSETVNPIKPKFEDLAATIQLHLEGDLPLPHRKSNMADGRRVENRYDVGWGFLPN